MIRVAEAEAQRAESQLRGLIDTSDARLQAISLCEPLLADAGLNRWLKKEREEAYSDWLKWILDQLGTAMDVLGVLGISDPEIVAACQSGVFKIDREHHVPGGRLDLLLSLDNSAIIIVEVKKYSAELWTKAGGLAKFLKPALKEPSAFRRYCTVGSASSGAPCLRNNCGRFCENADRGSTMSQPTS